MPEGEPNKRYTPEIRKPVMETMPQEKLSYQETCRFFVFSERRSAEPSHFGDRDRFLIDEWKKVL